MDIIFASDKLREQCNNSKKGVKAFGPDRARRLRKRLDDIDAAGSLDDFNLLPGRCHELTGTKRGQFSLDLDHPYRLIFEPAHNPVPRNEGGGLDWKGITAVRILGIEDTHE